MLLIAEWACRPFDPSSGSPGRQMKLQQAANAKASRPALPRDPCHPAADPPRDGRRARLDRPPAVRRISRPPSSPRGRSMLVAPDPA
jgi:hypothetical protein